MIIKNNNIKIKIKNTRLIIQRHIHTKPQACKTTTFLREHIQSAFWPLKHKVTLNPETLPTRAPKRKP
jgi:hypothetical protein